MPSLLLAVLQVYIVFEGSHERETCQTFSKVHDKGIRLRRVNVKA